MYVPSSEPQCRGSSVCEAIPPFLTKLCYRSKKLPQYIAEKRFVADIKKFDAAYLWPATSWETFRQVNKKEKPIFLERFNCYTGKAKRILDDAYTRLQVLPQHSMTSEKIQQEDAEVGVASYIFCPSPEVKKSFQEAGIAEEKLILTSYGWCPQRFSTIPVKEQQQNTLTVLFVGTVCVRKGAHLLLRAWERAGLKGKLVLSGKMEPVIAETCAELLRRSDVVHTGMNMNITTAFREADIFAFPTLEEGGPLVTYEAMAHGLPILTSPMGAGSIIREGIDAIILSPYDEDAWVEALRKLASSPELRAQFGASARERAEAFTWDKVAARRKELMLEKWNA
ncbi:MAG: glycosyltransferase family 4 protein [Microcoleus vaginatus WJT46-NPBG5]|jgi:glycosyltransferase involved in cell wall biosynthesis|nr:glycosyltransferase family 4 protein [Microcoleus vaginatus WJT46-NPBG5]